MRTEPVEARMKPFDKLRVHVSRRGVLRFSAKGQGNAGISDLRPLFAAFCGETV
jgi:hypothetical protein